MQFLKLMLIVGVLGFGATSIFNQVTASKSKSGFISVVMPDEASPNEVLVIGPNCNTDRGQRTRALAAKLAQAQIPHRRTDSVSISNSSDIAGMMRLNEVMQQDAPIVLIRGQAKGNPTAEEVIAMYQGEAKRKN
ncbi:MAG: hypothetical protein MUC48_11150 [Leptolyngbya sp. Prado105]|nr:hypothetical protein [Leptolyngbya sp. Prado105]